MANKTVLLIDDDPTIRHIIEIIIRGAGYQFFDAETVTEARKIIASQQNESLDIIICDVNLEHSNGIEFVDEIRKKEEFKKIREIPIVMLTVESSSEQKKKGKTVGANVWVVKPFLPDKLLQVIQHFIGTSVQ